MSFMDWLFNQSIGCWELRAEVAEARKALEFVARHRDDAIRRADHHAGLIRAMREERNRLRAECAMWRNRARAAQDKISAGGICSGTCSLNKYSELGSIMAAQSSPCRVGEGGGKFISEGGEA